MSLLDKDKSIGQKVFDAGKALTGNLLSMTPTGGAIIGNKIIFLFLFTARLFFLPIFVVPVYLVLFDMLIVLDIFAFLRLFLFHSFYEQSYLNPHLYKFVLVLIILFLLLRFQVVSVSSIPSTFSSTVCPTVFSVISLSLLLLFLRFRSFFLLQFLSLPTIRTV